MKPVLFAAALILFSGAALAQPSGAGQRRQQFNSENGLALGGYDVVSYFAGKPRKGNAGFSYAYKGITYRFGSQATLDSFKKSPEKYEPAYGGWCAYAMGASGEKVEIDPETYKIVDGRLYVFYNRFFTNTLDKWNKDEAGLKKKADTSWMKFYH